MGLVATFVIAGLLCNFMGEGLAVGRGADPVLGRTWRIVGHVLTLSGLLQLAVWAVAMSPEAK